MHLLHRLGQSFRYAPALALMGLAALPLAASAGDYPQRAPGLWQITTSSAMGAAPSPASVVQQCVDADSDQKLQQMGAGMSSQMKCEVNESRQQGDQYIGHVVCQMGPSKMEVRSVTQGDFSKAYTMTSEASFTPAMAGMKSSKSTMEAKWIGACKPDQKPGDVILPGGQKMNLVSGAPAQ